MTAAANLALRTVSLGTHRSSLRLERAVWAALDAACKRERMTVSEFVRQHGEGRSEGTRTSAVRCAVLDYWRAAATEAGHAAAGHGSMPCGRGRDAP